MSGARSESTKTIFTAMLNIRYLCNNRFLRVDFIFVGWIVEGMV